MRESRTTGVRPTQERIESWISVMAVARPFDRRRRAAEGGASTIGRPRVGRALSTSRRGASYIRAVSEARHDDPSAPETLPAPDARRGEGAGEPGAPAEHPVDPAPGLLAGPRPEGRDEAPPPEGSGLPPSNPPAGDDRADGARDAAVEGLGGAA